MTDFIHINHKPSRTFTSLVWGIFYLLIFAGSLPGHLVCVTADGLIQVEAACDCHDDSSNNPASLEQSPSNDFCGPCVDIPVSIHTDAPLIPAKDTAFQTEEPVFAAFAFSLPPFVKITPECFLPKSLAPLNSPCTFLRTVILLC